MKTKPATIKRIRRLDVRPLLARGDEPFQKIIETVASLGTDENLLLITPFLPSPLFEKLRSEGFQARPERRADGGWETLFTRE